MTCAWNNTRHIVRISKDSFFFFFFYRERDRKQRRKRERNLLGTGSQNKVQILLLFLLNLYYSSKVRYSLHYVYWSPLQFEKTLQVILSQFFYPEGCSETLSPKRWDSAVLIRAAGGTEAGGRPLRATQLSAPRRGISHMAVVTGQARTLSSLTRRIVITPSHWKWWPSSTGVGDFALSINLCMSLLSCLGEYVTLGSSERW